MSRISKRFKLLKAKKRAALITYIMGYDPDLKTSQQILDSLPEAGADIIELGMPFSDPMAEGPTIQLAAERALEAGGSVKGIIGMVKNFRKKDKDTPIILMGYFNPILSYGIKKFCLDCKNTGVDGCIIVDLPPEEEKEFTVHSKPAGIELIKLSAPTTDVRRAKRIYSGAGGFAYYVSIAGITGTKTADFSAVKERLKTIRRGTKLPIAVGFGIKTPEHVAEVSKFADGVVVGSAIVKIIENNLKKPKQVAEMVSKFVSNIRSR